MRSELADKEATVRTLREEISRLEREAGDNVDAANRLEMEASMLEQQAARY